MITAPPSSPPSSAAPPPRPPDPKGARTAWIALGSIIAVATLVYGVLSVVGLLSWAHKDVQFVFDDPVTTVDIDNDAGRVRVVAGAGDEIVVDADITYGLRDADVDAHVEGDRLLVRASCPIVVFGTCNVRYTVRVPADVAVRVRASGGGITVDGVEGAVDASSSGGGVRLVDTGGPIVARSSGGGVRGEDLRSDRVDASSSGGGVRLSFASPPSEVRASSSGGGVTVEVPDTPEPYAVQASSSGGSVRTSGVRHDPDSPRIIDVRSSGGGVTVRYREG